MSLKPIATIASDDNTDVVTGDSRPSDPDTKILFINTGFKRPEMEVYDGDNWETIKNGSQVPQTTVIDTIPEGSDSNTQVFDVEKTSKIGTFTLRSASGNNPSTMNQNTETVTWGSYKDQEFITSLTKTSNGGVGRQVEITVDLKEYSTIKAEIMDGNEIKNTSMSDTYSDPYDPYEATGSIDIETTGKSGRGVRLTDGNGDEICTLSGASGGGVFIGFIHNYYNGQEVEKVREKSPKGGFGSNAWYNEAGGQYEELEVYPSNSNLSKNSNTVGVKTNRSVDSTPNDAAIRAFTTK